MAKYCHNDVFDAALNEIKTSATKLVLTPSLPADYAAAVAAKLAEVTIDSSDFTGPADGDTSGRKLTVGAQGAVPVTVEGDPTHVCLLDTVGERLLYATEESGVQTLLVGNSADVPAWDIEIRDPT